MANKDQSLRDRILAADDLPMEAVEAWGEEFYIRTLTGAERDGWEASIVDTTKGKPRVQMENARAKLVVRCVVDEDGERIFADKDAKALGAKSSLEIARLYDVATRLNGITDEDVEELAGN